VKPDGQLFRHESARLLATLSRAFGVEHLALVEDAVQEALASAFAAWSHHGVPDHYAALLTTAARNRVLDAFRRERTARGRAPELQRFLESEQSATPPVEALRVDDTPRDDELRMMFSCCHPRLPEDVQVALVLNILCGFGAAEIARAFLVTTAAIEKRLSRGKKVLAESRHLFELTADDFVARLSAVQRALYLLFSEGYHGACEEALVREELCAEALRLSRLLVAHAPSSTPATRALAALMCLDAARLPGRIDAAGNLKALFEQDRSFWDGALIAEGLQLLDASATGDELTSYHVEAGIAARHAAAGSADETRWGEIVALYDVLMRIRPSPVVALNRAMAMAQHEGPAKGLAAIHAIEGTDRLAGYPFYPASLGELELRASRPEVAIGHFRAARQIARNDGERRFLDARIGECERKLST
jgi:RNA polymerase sigma-70 factor (ECF subfamily)